MLYPDFNELVSLKNRKARLKHPSNRLVNSIAPGDNFSTLRGQGLEFDSVREYVPGDDIRNIDWRVTARMGKPHLKLFRQEHERHIVICVDMNQSMRFGTRNTFKSVQAAHVAAILGGRALANNDRVSGCLFGDVPEALQFFAPSRNRKSLYPVLKMLAAPFSEQHTISLERALEAICRGAQTGSLIYVISDFMEIKNNVHEQMVMHRLSKKCQVVFIAVNDPADKEICPVGLLGFSASNSKWVVNTSDHAGRKVFKDQWDQNRQYLYELTAKLKIPLIELTTQSELHQVLAVELKRITGKRKLR